MRRTTSGSRKWWLAIQSFARSPSIVIATNTGTPPASAAANASRIDGIQGTDSPGGAGSRSSRTADSAVADCRRSIVTIRVSNPFARTSTVRSSAGSFSNRALPTPSTEPDRTDPRAASLSARCAELGPWLDEREDADLGIFDRDAERILNRDARRARPSVSTISVAAVAGSSSATCGIAGADRVGT